MNARSILRSLWKTLPYAALVALNLFLLSPVLLYELGLSSARTGSPDKIVLFALPASILWLVVLQLCCRPWIAHALLLPFYACVTVDLYLITHYRTRLTSSTITLILENRGNTGDYTQTHLPQLVILATLAICFYAAGLFAIRGLVFPVSKRARVAAVLGVVGLYGAAIGRQASAHGLKPGVIDVVSHDRNSPFGVVPQAFVAYQVYRDVLQHQRAAGSFAFGASRSVVPAEPELFVLVIGESARRDHWQLYGYERETNPRLSAEPNLIVFSDVLSQAALTQISVPLILTRSSIDDGGKRLAESSILSVYREVGFSTRWYSTQQRDQYTGAINRYSGEAGSSRFLDRQHDGALVELVGEALATRPEHRELFVLHTQGSHGQFSDRYPREFEIFPTGRRVSARENLINSYDNSVLYTDHVLTELIAMLKTRPGITAMLYVPDHGENLQDDGRDLLGHFFNNEYDLPIPMVFWYSDAFAQRYPGKLAAMRTNASKKINTRAVFYTLTDLANVVLEDPQLQTLSLLSPNWKGVPRQVLHRWEAVHRFESADYDRKTAPALQPVAW